MAAASHVGYELDQLCAMPNLLIETRSREEDDAYNAALEAMLVHARNLTEFLVRGRDRRDIHRHDFLPSWNPPRSAARARLERDWKTISEHLSHLSWQRVDAGRQEYKTDGLAQATLTVFEGFYAALQRDEPARAALFGSSMESARLRLRSHAPLLTSTLTATTNSGLLIVARFDD
jgi:hypothetical protein